MNRTSYLTCQNLIRHLRKWEIEHGSGWPGKGTNEPAKTLYPNLLAEMGWGFPWLRLPAEFADVSQEVRGCGGPGRYHGGNDLKERPFLHLRY